ncbi:MAG: hypothetical protein ABS39_11745 [Acidovorax sp. SCN 65-28]|jgi:general secretion pathway protein I|uniref:type IV pilus modification PilV family protein n=1 Tax=Acidovorax sp. TaxID=1872122 RepID=UPI00086DA048|nr:MAG: hypothetical protein ABS39_11745 [Acidovorax sp. SCN 65-28]
MYSLRRVPRCVRGFSLIEILVAFAIMAMSLAVLYRAMGSGIRDVGVLEQREKAVMLARSLLLAKDDVLPGDQGDSGVEDGLSWRVSVLPFSTEAAAARPGAVPLHLVVVSVDWVGGGTPQRLEFRTLRPQRKVPQAREGR